MMLLLAVPLDVLLAPIIRGAPLLALFGIAIQSVEGEPAGRPRCLLRAAITWGPLRLLALLQLGLSSLPRPSPLLDVLAPVMVAGAVAVILAWPDRGLVDLVVRTRLVPR